MVEVKSYSEEIEKEKVNNDIEDKLAKLKAKLQDKENMPPIIVSTPSRSYDFGVVGSGQAGGRIAEVFYNLGYTAVAINTAPQDLAPLSIPAANKLHLNFGAGGAAKDLDIGSDAADAYRDKISELLHDRFESSDLVIFTCSLGGGSGAGSVNTIIDILTSLNKPIVVITVLPQSSDDAQTKHNAVVTLGKLAKFAQTEKINNLIIVDNARIETVYKDVSQLNFFKVSNEAIVKPIDAFNKLSMMQSDVKPLDSTEFAKLFIDGKGLSVYGVVDVHNYEEETSFAEAVVENLSDSLLSSGFNLKQTRYVGLMFVAPKRVWAKVSNASVGYALTMLSETCGTPLGTFKGIYEVESEDDCVKIYSMFSGLGLPESRIEHLKNEAKAQIVKSEAKDEQRNLSLKLDLGDENVSQAEKIRKAIANKKSAFGKLHSNTVIDRRK
jgi:cell division protein FtsZ